MTRLADFAPNWPRPLPSRREPKRFASTTGISRVEFGIIEDKCDLTAVERSRTVV
jgi:hypothetical protein